VHADPPVEHKAYLHRSGRTARAGNDGTVVTLMVDDQVADVRVLTRKAGVKPTITKFSGASHPVLQEIAPGERSFTGGLVVDTPEPPARTAQQPGRRRRPQRHNGSGAAGSGGTGHSGGGHSGGGRGRGGQRRSGSGTARTGTR